MEGKSQAPEHVTAVQAVVVRQPASDCFDYCCFMASINVTQVLQRSAEGNRLKTLIMEPAFLAGKCMFRRLMALMSGLICVPTSPH